MNDVELDYGILIIFIDYLNKIYTFIRLFSINNSFNIKLIINFNKIIFYYIIYIIRLNKTILLMNKVTYLNIQNICINYFKYFKFIVILI